MSLNLDPSITELLARAAVYCATDSENALPILMFELEVYVGAFESALYTADGAPPVQVYGSISGSFALTDSQVSTLQAGQIIREPIDFRTHNQGPQPHERILVPVFSDNTLKGIWLLAVSDTGSKSVSHAQLSSAAHALSLILMILQARSAKEAISQSERRVREMATIHEIGQAVDQVETDELMDIITEKAARVMEAQACSLLLRAQDSNSLMIAASYGLQDEVVENTRVFIGHGIAGTVAETGEPLLLHDPKENPQFGSDYVSHVPNVGSSMCVPMRDADSSIQGVLCIRRASSSPEFTDEDMRLFGIFATQASMAINNRRLYARLNLRLQELSALSSLTASIISSRDLDEVLNQVADGIVNVVHFDICRIYLADLDTGRFSARIVRGIEDWEASTKDTNINIGEGIIGQVAQFQQPLLVDDLQFANRVARSYAQSLGLHSFYAQPIVSRGRTIGVVVVSGSMAPRSLSSHRIDLLSTFVHHAGIAIENARFYASQERRYAELTTLYEVSRSLAATSGVQSAAKTVTETATRVTESDTGLLLLLEPERQRMRAINWCGVDDHSDWVLQSFTVALPVSSASNQLRIPRVVTDADAVDVFGADWQPLVRSFISPQQSVALVPLVVEGSPVGFLLLGKAHAEYGVEQLRLISVASSQAASVLRSAADYERTIGQRELEISAVYDMIQRVRSARNLHEALDSILDIVASLVWSSRSLLVTVDESNHDLQVRAARGEGAAKFLSRSWAYQEHDTIINQALEQQTTVIGEDPQRNAGDVCIALSSDDDSSDVRSILAIPLIVGNESIGAILLESHTPGVYTSETARTLHLVASQAATIYREIASLRTLTSYTDNILRSIAAGVITLDKNGNIVTWNARAEEIINIKSSQIIGTHYREFIQMLQVDDAVREETMALVELTAKTGRVFTRNQMCYHSPQGDETYVNLSASQLKSESDEYLGVVVVFEDITNEIHMKQEMERVRKLAETGQLAANIAHELRNPLSSIKGATQLLRNELSDEHVGQYGEFFDIIIDEVNGLNRMTTEFLEFSRITPPQMKSGDLNALISRVLQLMGPFLSDQSIEVERQLDDSIPDIVMDREMIERAVKNIVLNSAQAMPRGGKLSIVTQYNNKQDCAEINITDTGVGIPPDKIDKIWTPFFTTKTKGTGLGLAIVLKSIDTHGGHMNLLSTPGEGSTFSIQLPIHPVHVASIPTARIEITEQRSDQPGGIFEPSLLESS